MNVKLGYEVGTGTVVDIPVKHMCITGQTQEAGKTTALEALIGRVGRDPAVAFVTKRGEGSFKDARIIKPYFREQADWQFVASILEASRGEKLKFERAWIIRASKGANTLAQVQANVRKAMLTAKGLSADVYLTLDAYLDAVVPTIAKVSFAPTVNLQPGLNVMDLSTVPVEMQHLVIKSTLDWVLANAHNTIVIVPEAWKFIPQGRNTPVKLAAEAYIRQAAGLQNYLWLDSQDIGGIDKAILRSVVVWVLGVQREANEIKRTLENLPASVPKVTPALISSLELGQFFACWGKKAVKTYVQPTWLEDDTARLVANGELMVEFHAAEFHAAEQDARLIDRQIDELNAKFEEVEVTEQEANELRETIKRGEAEIARLKAELERLRVFQADVRSASPPTHSVAYSPDKAGNQRVPLKVDGVALGHDLYEAIKAKLIADAPAVLRVLVDRPELEVQVERKTIQVDGQSLKGRIAQMIARGFYNSAKGPTDSKKELDRTGRSVHPSNVRRALDDLVADGFLTDDAGQFQAVAGMKVNIVG